MFVATFNKKPFTGKGVLFYNTGEIKCEISYYRGDRESYKIWFKNGQLKENTTSICESDVIRIY